MSAVAASNVAGDGAAAQAIQLQEMSHAIRRLECMVEKLDQDLHSAERHLDDLEQYGRRNCLILHGCKTESLKKASYSDFEKFVLKLLNNRLKLDLTSNRKTLILVIFFHLGGRIHIQSSLNLCVDLFVRLFIKRKGISRAVSKIRKNLHSQSQNPSLNVVFHSCPRQELLLDLKMFGP